MEKNHKIMQWKNKKKSFILCGICAFLFIFGYFATKQDAFLYNQSIVRVLSVETTKNEQKADPQYWQKITAVILNKENKGKTITFTNTFTKSQIASEKYKKNDEIFVKIQQIDSRNKVSVIEVKRDTSLFVLGFLLLISLLLLAKKQGFFTIVSLGVNLSFFFWCMTFVERKTFFTFAWLFLSVAFCFFTLFLTSGFHKKTFGALLSSLTCVLIMLFIYQITIYTNHDISYELMPDMVNVLPLKDIFRTSVMIGLLGAVMDIAITINASVEEMQHIDPDITMKQLMNSIQEIGYDIMGTMVNILFFSYIGSSLPLLTLQVFHKYDMISIFENTMVFDAGRFLIGAIGIVVAIPISGFFAILLFFSPWKRLAGKGVK